MDFLLLRLGGCRVFERLTMLLESDIEAIVEHLAAKVQFYDARGAADNTRARNEIRTALESFVGISAANEPPKISPLTMVGSVRVSRLRDDLVKIAFDKQLRAQLPNIPDFTAFGRQVVAAADAVLAAMEPTPDTGAAIIPLIRQRLQNALADERASSKRHPTQREDFRQYRDGCENGLERAIAIVKAMDATPDTGPSKAEIERRARALAGTVLDGVEYPLLSGIRAAIQTRVDVDAKVHASNPAPNLRTEGYREGVRDDRMYVLAMIYAAMEKPGEAENDKDTCHGYS